MRICLHRYNIKKLFLPKFDEGLRSGTYPTHIGGERKPVLDRNPRLVQ